MKPYRHIFIALLIFCALPMFVWGQGENNIWTFGMGAGLNFNTGTPALFPNAISTSEGCAAVSNAAGQLLFYSNGDKVFDANHTVMPNGNGILGNFYQVPGTVRGSSTQGVAIVPKPGSSNLYYLFTLDPDEYIMFHNQQVYTRYSVIDMSLNGGLGDVVATQKNIVIDSGSGEKMTTVRGAGCYTWVITHQHSDPEFHAFKIDGNGVHPAVVSTSGTVSPALRAFRPHMKGKMVVSPNDSLLAHSNSDAFIELHDFNKTTGVISNVRKIDRPLMTITWGLEFSPDSKKLYLSSCANVLGVTQYDLSLLPDMIAVNRSMVPLEPPGRFSDDLRLGPDQKIYIISTQKIDRIDNPNRAGTACNFMQDVIPGLPMLIGTMYFGSPVVLAAPDASIYASHDTTICFGPPITLTAPAGYAGYFWSDGSTTRTDTIGSGGIKWVRSVNGCTIRIDSFKIQAFSDTAFFARDTNVCFSSAGIVLTAPAGFNSRTWSDGSTLNQATYTTPGTKWVISRNACHYRIDTFKIQAISDTLFFAKDTSICFSTAGVVLNAPSGYTSWTWSDGNTLNRTTYTTPGPKWVISRNTCHYRIDTFKVQSYSDTVFFVRDTTVCLAASAVRLSAPAGYGSRLWSNGDTLSYSSYTTAGPKWVISRNTCHYRIDTIHVKARAFDTTISSTNIVLCFPDTIQLTGPAGFQPYEWSDGSRQNTATFTTPGPKWVVGRNGCNVRVDSTRLTAGPIDTTYQTFDTLLCLPQQVIVTATSGYNYYVWSDGSTGQSNTFSAPGVRSVYMQNGCFGRLETYRAGTANLPVSLGTDTVLCMGDSIMLDASVANGIYKWQDGSQDPTYMARAAGQYSVDVRVGHCSKKLGINIFRKELNISLGGTKKLCNGAELLLDATTAGVNYRWQDGSNQATLQVNAPGRYWVTISQSACTASDTANIEYHNCNCTLISPNAFTPNNDGRNDVMRIKVYGESEKYKLSIYNRWGQCVFTTFDPDAGWDGTFNGKNCDMGTYYFIVTSRCFKGEEVMEKGEVMLIR